MFFFTSIYHCYLGDELNNLREHLERVESENSQLTSALQSAIEDNAHMSEKLLLSEQAQESLRVNFLFKLEIFFL